jgi:hypothetical protein
MIRWKSAKPSPSPQRWQSREEIVKSHLDSLAPDELRRVRPDYYWFRFGQAAAIGASRKYDPNQPRVPAGNPDGGQWTSEDGTDDLTSNDAPQPAIQTCVRKQPIGGLLLEPDAD